MKNKRYLALKDNGDVKKGDIIVHRFYDNTSWSDCYLENGTEIWGAELITQAESGEFKLLD